MKPAARIALAICMAVTGLAMAGLGAYGYYINIAYPQEDGNLLVNSVKLLLILGGAWLVYKAVRMLKARG